MTSSNDIGEEEDGSHAGSIQLQSLNPFAVYGFTESMNLLFTVPLLYWQQDANHEDNHHRTETVAGFGDVSLGVRWLVVNQSFGPGQRFFIGMNISLPTGESYEVNPFSNDADSIEHRHFALGDRLISSSVNFEWWYRSEFPFVLGLSGQYNFPWTKSDIGFLPGKKILVNLHAIRQAPLLRGLFPYAKLTFRSEKYDSWEGTRASNSGGTMIDGMAGFDFEVSERVSAVLSYNFPLWRKLEGSQLDPVSISFSFRWVRD